MENILKVDLNKLKENQVKWNVIVQLRKTTDEHFNEIFNTVKDYDIYDYQFPFDVNLFEMLNHKNYKFQFP